MEDDSSLGGEPSPRLQTCLGTPVVEVSDTEIKNEVVVEGPSTMESIETMSLVGGRVLDMPMLFCSPDPHLWRWSPGSHTRIPRQGTNNKLWSLGVGSRTGHLPPLEHNINLDLMSSRLSFLGGTGHLGRYLGETG